MKLNLGSGNHIVDGWVNVDYAIGARFASIPFFRETNRRLGIFAEQWDDRIALDDLRKPLPGKTIRST